MKNRPPRNRRAELALSLAIRDQRLRSALQQRPYLMNPYPGIIARLSRRSRRFRIKVLGVREPRRPIPVGQEWRVALKSPVLAGTAGR